MAKIALKDLQSDQAAVTKALAAIKDPQANPTGDAPGDNNTTSSVNHNFYYDDRTTYRDYVKAYNKLTKDQADYLGDNPAPNSGDMQTLEGMYNDARKTYNLGGDELHGQQLIDALKANKGALDPASFNADKAISLGGRLYQGEDLQHRTDADGKADLSSGPMDTRFTDYQDVGGTHQLNGHLLTQAQDSSGKSIKNFDDLKKGMSARSYYMAANEGKDPKTGQVVDQFKDSKGKVIHDAPFVQTSDGKIYYPVYDGGSHYISDAFANAKGPISDAAKKQVGDAVRNNPELQYAWVEKDTRGWFQTALDVLGSAPAAFALLPLDPLFGLAGKGVAAVASAGVSVARSVYDAGISAVAGSAGAVSTRLIREGASSLPQPKLTAAEDSAASADSASLSATGDDLGASTTDAGSSIVNSPSKAINNQKYLDDATMNPKIKGGVFFSPKYKNFWDANAANSASSKQDYVDKLLFGETRIARIQDAPQGAAEDCWLMSGMQYEAQKSADTIKNKFHYTEDGNLRVTVNDSKGVAHDVMITPELAVDSQGSLLYGGSTRDGLWAAYYEKAAAKLASYEGRRGSRVTGYDALTGGTLEEADTMLTGNVGGKNSFKYFPDQKTWGRGTMKSDGPETGKYTFDGTRTDTDTLTASMTRALQGSRPVVAGVPKDIPELNLVGPHAYSLIAYDSQAKSVTLLNPHPGTASGLDRVEVSLDDLAKYDISLYLPT